MYPSKQLIKFLLTKSVFSLFIFLIVSSSSPIWAKAEEIPGTGKDFLKSTFVFVGRVDSLDLSKFDAYERDHKVTVRVGKVYRGEPGIQLTVYVRNRGPKFIPEIGKDYLFSIRGKSEPYRQSFPLPVIDAVRDIEIFDEVTKTPGTDEELGRRFIEVRKRQAEERKKECEKMKSSEKRACLESIPGLLRL